MSAQNKLLPRFASQREPRDYGLGYAWPDAPADDDKRGMGALAALFVAVPVSLVMWYGIFAIIGALLK